MAPVKLAALLAYQTGGFGTYWLQFFVPHTIAGGQGCFSLIQIISSDCLRDLELFSDMVRNAVHRLLHTYFHSHLKARWTCPLLHYVK
jgi:hypothetical protein